MRPKVNVVLLLIGMFAETHIRVIGSIGISELFIFIVAPFVFLMDMASLKRNGFMPLVMLALMSSLGCIISSYANETNFQWAIRGFASTYALFAVPVVIHHFLSRDLGGLRWLLVGLAISGLITLFGFHSGVESAVMEKTGGDFMSSELFFSRHFGRLVTLPYEAWYLETPFWLTLALLTVPVIYTICTTSTGRSALLASLVSVFLVFYARRKRSKMVALRKKLFWFCVIGGFCAIVTTSGYKFAAKKGWLNEKAQLKYESQTSTGSGPLAILMKGRAEFFVGTMACLDKPVVGYGPWAFDNGHYWGEFITKYGSEEDVEAYAKALLESNQRGGRMALIPAHSHIVGFWLWYGILGLPFWAYIIKKSADYFRYALDAIPQWFGFVALSLPSMMWSIFFSPFTGRITTNIQITCMLLALAVAKGKLKLPYYMQMEIMRKDKR